MLNKITLSLGLLMFFSGCTIWQSRTEVLKESERETITKTTEVQEVLTESGIQLLTKEIYTEEISKEVATAERKRSHSSPAVSGGITKALGFLGIPPEIVAAVMAAVTGAGAIKGYDTVRNMPPKKPKNEAQV